MISSDPWSYMISSGLGYLINHVVSTKSATYIALLSQYLVIMNHPVTGSIMVTDFRFKFYFHPFLLMTQGEIIFTHSLFHGIYLASLAGNLPYYLFGCFVRW